MSILIYNDEGAGEDSVSKLYNCLSEFYQNKYNIILINAEVILENNWQSHCKAICFGGGYDLGFLKKLGIIGCEIIREFVDNGGCYIGICAGAYFASRYIEFDKDGPLEVVGDRFICLFDGKAVGPIYPGFEYETRNGVRAAKMISNQFPYNPALFYEGGCAFTDTFDKPSVCVYFSYAINNEAAIINCRCGRGQALLSGVHFEYSYREIDFPLSPSVDEDLRSSEPDRSRLAKDLFSSLNL